MGLKQLNPRMNRIKVPHDSLESRFIRAIISLCEILDPDHIHHLPEDLRLNFSLSRIMHDQDIEEVGEEYLKCAADHLGNVLLCISRKTDSEVRVNVCKQYQIHQMSNRDFRISFALPRNSVQIIQQQILEVFRLVSPDDVG